MTVDELPDMLYPAQAVHDAYNARSPLGDSGSLLVHIGVHYITVYIIVEAFF